MQVSVELEISTIRRGIGKGVIMRQRNKVLMGIGIGTAVSLLAIGLTVARRRGFGKVLGEWRDERIRDAYYNTITEKDIAWG